MSAVAVTKKRAWIAVRKRTEQRHERVEAGIGARRKLRASEATDVGVLKCGHVDAEGGGARAGGPFILNLGRGSGGPGRGGGGAETACAVRRK